MKKLDYTFKLKDFETTKTNHLGKMKKLRDWNKNLEPVAIKGDLFDLIMTHNWLEEVEYLLKTGTDDGHSSMWWEWQVNKPDGRLHDYKKSQAKLREVKTAINGITRHYIKQNLKWHDLPESWDTAFYLYFYTKINKGMERLARHYL